MNRRSFFASIAALFAAPLAIFGIRQKFDEFEVKCPWEIMPGNGEYATWSTSTHVSSMNEKTLKMFIDCSAK